ncbi:MAG: hypothetical protein HQK91_14070 [Nitrospirae bacterium]|nr:hypothetical protein [Nitrospirota bacterium]
MPYIYSIQDISSTIGLEVPFIEQCVSEMEEIFNPLKIVNSQNKPMFEKGALKIFEDIYYLKLKGLEMNEIKAQLGYGVIYIKPKLSPLDIEETETTNKSYENTLRKKNQLIESLQLENLELKKHLDQINFKVKLLTEKLNSQPHTSFTLFIKNLFR